MKFLKEKHWGSLKEWEDLEQAIIDHTKSIIIEFYDEYDCERDPCIVIEYTFRGKFCKFSRLNIFNNYREVMIFLETYSETPLRKR